MSERPVTWSVCGSSVTSWFRLWTAAMIQCAAASYWVLPTSPPSGMVAHDLVGCRIDDGVSSAAFVGDVQLAKLRVVGDAVRVLAARNSRHDRQTLGVDHGDLIGVSPRRTLARARAPPVRRGR